MDLISLLGYLFKTDPKLRNVQLPEDPLSIDIPGLMEMLKDPSITTISTLPFVKAPSEMCLSVPDDMTGIKNQMISSPATTPKMLGSALEESSLQAISPKHLQRLNPLSSTLKPNNNKFPSDSVSVSSLQGVSGVSAAQVSYSVPDAPGLIPHSGAAASKHICQYPAEFVRRVIPISRKFYLSYCVFDYWALFSGLHTSPTRLKRIVTNEKPRADPYVELLDEDSFKEILTAIRANLNLPAADLISIAGWIGRSYAHIHSKRAGEKPMTRDDILTLPCFKNGLLFLLITLSQLFRRLDERDLATWVEALCSSQLDEELPPAMLEDQSALVSTNILVNLASRHIMLLASSLLEQLNKRFYSFFELSPTKWEKLSIEVEKLYIICKSLSETTSFVNTSLNVSSLEVDTGLHLDALSGIADMTDYKKVNPGDSRPRKDFSQTSLSERFCLAMDAMFKILQHMSDLAGDKSILPMIDRLALFAQSTCLDFIEELIRLLVQNMETQNFYEEYDHQTLYACWTMVDLLYKTYVHSMLLKCKQIYGFVNSGDDSAGLVFGIVPDSNNNSISASSIKQANLQTPGPTERRKRNLRKEYVLTTYDSYSFFLVIIKLCNFKLVQNYLSYNSILTFLREYVNISDRSEIDEVCSIVEPYLSDYTGNFHSNGYGLRYTLTIMHIVFSKYYESDDFSSLQLGSQCSKDVLSTPAAMYIYQVRLQKYLCTAVTRQLNRLYSQSEAEAIDELMTCTSIQNYLTESLVDADDVIELDLNDLNDYTFQQVNGEDSEARAQKQAEKEALRESIQFNCKPNPFAILAKLFLILVDQITIDASIHLPIFSDAFFDSSIMFLEHGSGLSSFLYNVYISTSFCSVSRFVGMPSPPPARSPPGSPLIKQMPGLLSEAYCELVTETVVMEENAGKIRVSPISIYAGLIIKFINDKISSALVTFSHMNHGHHISGTTNQSHEVHNILNSPEIVESLSKIKFQEVKDMLKHIDTAMMTLGLAFYNFYIENKTYNNWMEKHLNAASIARAQHSVIKKALSFIFPPDISIILATPLLSLYITKEADHISIAVNKIYNQETNLSIMPFNWLVTSKALREAGEITDVSERCNSLHYNASSAPIDCIEPVLLFLESIFKSFHLSAACLRCLCSQMLDLIRVILQPIYYNNSVIEYHKMPVLMQLFSIDDTLQGKNMMKQSTTKKPTSVSTDSNLGSSLSEKSFTSSCLSAQIISQKGYKSSLDVASSVACSSPNSGRTKHIFSWDVDNTGQSVHSSKNELLVGRLTIRKRTNSITLKARAYESRLSPDESAISSILPMGSGVPSGALLFSSCKLTELPKSFSDIIQQSRVFTYRINSLDVLLARISSVYDYLSSHSVSYDIADCMEILNNDNPLVFETYWIINTKQSRAAETKPAKDESTMLLEYFSSIVKEIRSTIMINIKLLCGYIINTGLCPLLQRAYCPVVMQTQLRTAWSGLEIALKDIYRNIIPSYIKCIAETIAVAALNAHSFILLDSGPRARTITPSDSKVLNEDLLFLKEVLVGNTLCGEEYIAEYKRLFKAAHTHGVIVSKLPGLYLSVDDAGADYTDCILKPSFISSKAIQAEDLVCLHTLKSERLMSMGNIEDNHMLLEQLDTPKNITTDVITHSEYVVRVLNFRRYSEPMTREWLHKLKKNIKKQ